MQKIIHKDIGRHLDRAEKAEAELSTCKERARELEKALKTLLDNLPVAFFTGRMEAHALLKQIKGERDE